jgi:hypothetical protein
MRTSVVRGLRIFLDVAIVFYLVLIPIIFVTGGFQINIWGFAVKATHVYTPLKFLIPLALLRLLISAEVRNAMLVVASILISLLCAELSIRIWDPPIAQPGWRSLYRTSPVLGWELVPGAVGVGKLGETYRINSAGFRGTEYSREKTQGLRRIAVIGDSFTFGAGVNAEDTYPAQLQRLLAQRNIDSEVMNFGVINHDMWQHYVMLKTRVLPYTPDLVILAVFTNDLERPVAPDDIADNDEIGRNPYEKGGAKGLLKKSALWNFLTHATAFFEYKYRYRQERYLRSIADRRREVTTTDHFLYKIMTGNLDSRKSVAFADTLRDFVTTAKKAGAKVVVVYIPDSVQLGEPNLQVSNRFVEKMARELGTPFVDTTPFLEAVEDRDSLYLFPFDAHNSRQGLGIVAAAIADKLVELNLLERRKSAGKAAPYFLSTGATRTSAPNFGWSK